MRLRISLERCINTCVYGGRFFYLGGIMKKFVISLFMMMGLAVFAQAFACDSTHPDETSTTPGSPTPDSSSTAK